MKEKKIDKPALVVSVRKKLSSHGMRWKDLIIAYDYDDILWEQIKTAAKIVGVDETKIRDFYLDRNPSLTSENVKELLHCLYTAEFYRDIKFLPGAQDIMRPQLEFGIPVTINSKSGSKEIHQLKFEQLKAIVPEITEANFKYQETTHATSRQKLILPNTLIMIDDNPYNIAMSQASVNLMRQIPWNSTKRAKEQVKLKLVFWYKTLNEINQATYTITQFLHKELNTTKE